VFRAVCCLAGSSQSSAISRWRSHTHDISCIVSVRLLWRKESRAAETDGYAVIASAACDLGGDPTKRRERLIHYQCRPTPALTATQFAAHASCTGRRPPMRRRDRAAQNFIAHSEFAHWVNDSLGKAPAPQKLKCRSRRAAMSAAHRSHPYMKGAAAYASGGATGAGRRPSTKIAALPNVAPPAGERRR
jgi:hypothetical protein